MLLLRHELVFRTKRQVTEILMIKDLLTDRFLPNSCPSRDNGNEFIKIRVLKKTDKAPNPCYINTYVHKYTDM